jgi:hypothetical protein
MSGKCHMTSFKMKHPSCTQEWEGYFVFILLYNFLQLFIGHLFKPAVHCRGCFIRTQGKLPMECLPTLSECFSLPLQTKFPREGALNFVGTPCINYSLALKLFEGQKYAALALFVTLWSNCILSLNSQQC